MIISDLFARDIDRAINGVVMAQDKSAASEHQELDEYVVTRELQRHFAAFFDNYERGFDAPAANTGVWISGSYGSGKSHLLKVLSYLLENKESEGKHAIDYFDGKIADQMVYAKMRRCCDAPTETILFDIASLGSQWKEGDTAHTALLRAFERAFFEHLGFYAEDMKLPLLELNIEERGKTEEFRAAFERISEDTWVESRVGYKYFGDALVQALSEAGLMSSEAAWAWFKNDDDDAIAAKRFAQIVSRYVDDRSSKLGKDFRLVFMADEVGQFIGDDVSLMLDLQTLAHEFGSNCGGHVWIMVTSQEKIDNSTNVVGVDFSKILARFETRLLLSSSSADEVIQRRLLEKNDAAQSFLEQKYDDQSVSLKNVFTFEGSRTDLIGYGSRHDFVASYPFVNYQFKVLPDVMTAVSANNLRSSHMSTGERSMLSCFQDSAKAIEDDSFGSLAPFWRFFDTLWKDLDHGIIQVVERATRAAEDGHGLEADDVKVLKLLYLIRYIDYIKSNIENISILMVDRMDVDKVELKERIKKSLDRLVRENYVARQGDTYNFLTNEEQDISRKIREVEVDTASIIEKIKTSLFEGIYSKTKLRVGANDFPFDRYVDDSVYGVAQGGMKLNVVTVADQLSRASDTELAVASTGMALVVLADDVDYFEDLHNAAKIEKYCKSINVQQLPPSTQKIIAAKRQEERYIRKEAAELIKEAVVNARVAVNQSLINLSATKPADVFDQALSKLASAIFTKADYIAAPVKTDDDIRATLAGKNQQTLDGQGTKNMRAEKEVAEWLHVQTCLSQTATMGDVQRQFQKAPFGWREIDVANVVAQLVATQCATITVAGNTVSASDSRMVSYLRKDAEKAQVAERFKLDNKLIKNINRLLREIFRAQRTITDEDELKVTMEQTLVAHRDYCIELINGNFTGLAPAYPYPGKDVLEAGVKLLNGLLDQKNDTQAFFKAVLKAEDDIDDWYEQYEQVKEFFDSQKPVFDKAVGFMGLMHDEGFYMESDDEATAAIDKIAKILKNPRPYREIKDLQPNMAPVLEAHKKMVDKKRNSLLDDIDTQIEQVRSYAQEQDGYVKVAERAIENAGRMADSFKSRTHAEDTASGLASIKQQLMEWSDQACDKIDHAVEDEKTRMATERRMHEVTTSGEVVTKITETTAIPKTDAVPASKTADHVVKTAPATKIKKVKLSDLGERKKLSSEDDVNAYVEQLRARLLAELQNVDAIRLS